MRDTEEVSGPRDGDVVLGDDWVIPQDPESAELRARRSRRNLISVRSSPLARKIITFNVFALVTLVAGLLYLDDSRKEQVQQRARSLVGDAQLVSNVFETQLRLGTPVILSDVDGTGVKDTLSGLKLRNGVEVFVFDESGTLIGWTRGTSAASEVPGFIHSDAGPTTGGTLISDALNAVWKGLSTVFSGSSANSVSRPLAQRVQSMIPNAISGNVQVQAVSDSLGDTVIVAAVPVLLDGATVGAVAMAGPAGEIDDLTRKEQERVLQMFLVALLVSVGLSLVLASTIANPLADLAAAAEMGRDKNSKQINPGRIRIPDLSGRPDEIGRLSRALRGMVKALYNRIDANEQFAADVAHEIKNPLASLQSAVGTLRMVKRDDQREKLMGVIEHDVRRLDRLVSDIRRRRKNRPFRNNRRQATEADDIGLREQIHR